MKPCFEMKPDRLVLFARLADDADVKYAIKSALTLVKEKGMGEVGAKKALES